jgi:hypothetical protein
MPRGGHRIGAGRPAGSKAGAKALEPDRGADPLSYMLSVMRDVSVTPLRRDKMAIAAAPFCHAKAVEVGKKQAAEENARTSHLGTRWQHLLERDDGYPPAEPDDKRSRELFWNQALATPLPDDE